MDLYIIKPHQCYLDRLSSVLSGLSQNLFSDLSPLGGSETYVYVPDPKIKIFFLESVNWIEIIMLDNMWYFQGNQD